MLRFKRLTKHSFGSYITLFCLVCNNRLGLIILWCKDALIYLHFFFLILLLLLLFDIGLRFFHAVLTLQVSVEIFKQVSDSKRLSKTLIMGNYSSFIILIRKTVQCSEWEKKTNALLLFLKYPISKSFKGSGFVYQDKLVLNSFYC